MPIASRLIPIVVGVAMVCIAAAPTVAEESLRVLQDRSEALQSRADLIEQAQHSIDLAYYSIDGGEVPTAILELLRQASCRGVRVRMLVDGLRARLPPQLTDYLCRSGVQISLYHPLLRGNPTWLNHRLHIKLMVCDGETAIIGSRNLENEHFEFDCEQNYIDCDAIVWGDVARRSQTFFDLLWSASDVKRCQAGGLLEMQFPSGNVFERSDWDQAWRRAAGPADCQRLLQQAVERVACRCSVQLPGDAARDWRDSAIHGSDLRLLHDGRANKSRSSMQDQIIRLVDGARCAVLIESPYPALDRRTRAAISRARKRGVAVTILTNSLDSTNHVCVYAAYQNQKRSLLREGVVLREYCGREILHAKMMIVDDGVCLLGSHNFDARSDYLNLELCIVACDAAAVAAVREHLQNRLSRSTRIDADSWILPVGGDAPLHKRVGLTLQRLVVELYRGLL